MSLVRYPKVIPYRQYTKFEHFEIYRFLSYVLSIPLAVLSTRLVETRARQHGQCWRVMETGHPSTRAVNSGRQLG